jgi:dihydroflavonol-4-reductase
MTILVTGGSGFVGHAVVRLLVAEGCRVRALVRPATSADPLHALGVEVVEGDLTDPPSLRAAVDGCDGLYHVAADYRLWVPDPACMIQVNVDGTRHILEAASDAGVKRVVYTSSVAVLGLRGDRRPADESEGTRLEDMIGPYKRSKFLAEAEVRRVARERRLPVVIVNPSTPAGPGDRKPTPTGRMIVDAASGRMPAFVDTGLNIVHVDDVARGHLLAYDKGEVGERYILGGEDLPLAVILEKIARLVGRRPPRVRLPHGAVMPLAHLAEAWCRCFGGEPFATCDGVRMARAWMFFSSAKAQRALGYDPRPADQALADAIADFRRTGMVA